MLGLYTGQRGSDIVRLGWTNIAGKGFDLGERGQQKTGVRPWCPILPELAAEMATWERRPGPFLLRSDGKPFTRQLLDNHFNRTREELPELAGATLHGLRATAIIRLRREGLSPLQIQDIVGLSLPMIQRYCRFADKRANGEAVLVHLEQVRRNRDCKALENSKTNSE
jgi:integrase